MKQTKDEKRKRKIQGICVCGGEAAKDFSEGKEGRKN